MMINAPSRIRSGAVLDLLAPDWRMIRLEDIAYQLARLPRFCGATIRPISVLEHSFTVMGFAPERFRLAAVLHDAHEAYISDIPAPVQMAITKLLPYHVAAFDHALGHLRQRIDLAIAMQVLSLVPVFAADPGGAAHCEAARVLAAEMLAKAVVMADRGATMIELNGYFPGADGAKRALALESYPLQAPFAEALYCGFFDTIEAELSARFGLPVRVPCGEAFR